MIKHLTQKDIERYVIDSEPDEEYLEWFEEVSIHVSDCETCRELIRKQMMIEMICEPNGEALSLGLEELAKDKNIPPIVPFGMPGGFRGADFAAANRPVIPAACPPAAASVSTQQPPQTLAQAPASEKKTTEKKSWIHRLFKKDDQ